MRSRNQKAIEQEARIQAEGYDCMDGRPDPHEVFVKRVLDICWVIGNFPAGNFPLGPEHVPGLLGRAAREWPAFIKERQVP